jgi:hypothetical protein
VIRIFESPLSDAALDYIRSNRPVPTCAPAHQIIKFLMKLVTHLTAFLHFSKSFCRNGEIHVPKQRSFGDSKIGVSKSPNFLHPPSACKIILSDAASHPSLPQMRQPQLINAMVAIACYLVLSLTILSNQTAELLLQPSQEHTHQRVVKRKREDDDVSSKSSPRDF